MTGTTAASAAAVSEVGSEMMIGDPAEVEVRSDNMVEVVGGCGTGTCGPVAAVST